MSLQRQTARLAQEQQEAMKRVAQDTVRRLDLLEPGCCRHQLLGGSKALVT